MMEGPVGKYWATEALFEANDCWLSCANLSVCCCAGKDCAGYCS